MEQAVLFVNMYMQLQTALCYVYDNIFVTQFLNSNSI